MNTKGVFGIDLGTTYSCIARVDEHGKPEVIPNAEGQQATPSVVYFESEDKVVVGDAAKEEAAFHPDLVLEMVKRHMGKDVDFEYHGRLFKPQEISAYILKKLANDAEVMTGEKVENVVITCPAYFGVEQKEATMQAGLIAGLNVLYVIPEPTAAAIAYGMNQSEEQVILVYDLGGGTFDISLIEVSSGTVSVLSTGGDDQLGGKDWDGKLVEYFANAFSQETGVSSDEVLADSETRQNMIADAEDAKISLTAKNKVKKAVRFDVDRTTVELGRDRFDKLTAPELERTISFTEEMIQTAKAKGYDRIDKILLVGGSTFMPQVRARLAQLGIDILIQDPNQIVAKGAAIFGYKCQLEEMIRIAIAEETGRDAGDIDLASEQGSTKNNKLKEIAHRLGLPPGQASALVAKRVTNVTSKSFGVVVMDVESNAERVVNLIQKDQQVPCDAVQQFGTFMDDQASVDIRCMENQIISDPGQTLDPTDCTMVGNAVLGFERRLPKGSPVEIRFRLGPDGRLQMEGKDLSTGGTFETVFETASVMTQNALEEARSTALTMSVS